ncbi:MAG: orotidine-5'-phosphate decarboxylase [Acaryochloridaceae cyanobacterium SU_2_1]|nr:orotidine-5'-phosphate decarboxylase [Acaryochloridaceae cyanobacterium SU_2_1]
MALKDIKPQDRLIVALDLDSNAAAKALVETLGDTVVFYKLGLELFIAGEYYEMLTWLLAQGKQVFVDLKFFDVPQTVGSAVRQLRDKGATFATVHGNNAILEAAVAQKGDLKILAVTVLTSLDRHDLEDLGFQCDPEALVLSRAKRAMELGCDGVISSGLEAKALRQDLGNNFLIVTPGIRPVDNDIVDDQKRTVDVEQAFMNGADYIVVGRPIRDAQDPHQMAHDMQERITRLFPA